MACWSRSEIPDSLEGGGEAIEAGGGGGGGTGDLLDTAVAAVGLLTAKTELCVVTVAAAAAAAVTERLVLTGGLGAGPLFGLCGGWSLLLLGVVRSPSAAACLITL